MAIVGSFSYTPDKLKLIEDIQRIAKRDGKSFSEVVVLAMEDYQKAHGAGNAQYQLGNWVDQPEFKAYPAFASDRKKWMEHLQQSNKKEIEYLRNQADMIKDMAGRYLDMIRRGNDITKTYLG